MFGNNDQKAADDGDKTMAQVADAVQALNNDTGSQPQDTFAPDAGASAPTDTPATDTTPAPAADAATLAPGEKTIEPLSSSTGHPSDTPPAEPATPADTPAAAAAILSSPLAPSAPAAADDDLLDIKQTALQQLKPLVDHLDSVPEEKFDALMMMIRASDDQSLIQPAFDAAQKITDDKKRAEALLDVVNEINYLTSSQQ